MKVHVVEHHPHPATHPAPARPVAPFETLDAIVADARRDADRYARSAIVEHGGE